MKYVAFDGSYYCYLSDNGIRVRRLGCRHETPRQAALHTVPHFVNPLRLPGESPVPVPGQPAGERLTEATQTASPRNTPPLPSPAAGLRGA